MATAPSPHPGMGAVPHDGGCTFRVWAPNAQAVWVASDFSAPPWDAAKVALARDDNAPDGSGHEGDASDAAKQRQQWGRSLCYQLRRSKHLLQRVRELRPVGI